MSAVQMRLPEAEQNINILVRRELDNWRFFRRLIVGN